MNLPPPPSTVFSAWYGGSPLPWWKITWTCVCACAFTCVLECFLSLTGTCCISVAGNRQVNGAESIPNLWPGFTEVASHYCLGHICEKNLSSLSGKCWHQKLLMSEVIVSVPTQWFKLRSDSRATLWHTTILYWVVIGQLHQLTTLKLYEVRLKTWS